MENPNTPFEKIWEKLDKLYHEDMEKHKDDYFYKSGFAPDMIETGYVNRNHNTSINLSSIATYIIQNVGRFCERYASDFLIDWDNVQDAIEDPNPDAKPVYVWMGLRDSGVDGIPFIANRITEYSNYYRKIYSIRITHSTSDNYESSANITVEFRDMTSHSYDLYKYYKEHPYSETVNEEPVLTTEEKNIAIREDIQEIAYLIRKINALKNRVYNNTEGINDDCFDMMDSLINNETDAHSVIETFLSANNDENED